MKVTRMSGLWKRKLVRSTRSSIRNSKNWESSSRTIDTEMVEALVTRPRRAARYPQHPSMEVNKQSVQDLASQVESVTTTMAIGKVSWSTRTEDPSTQRIAEISGTI